MEQKYRGMLSYLFGWISGLIILFGFKDNDSRTKFNACQSITLDIAILIISAVAKIVGTILFLISAILGIVFYIAFAAIGLAYMVCKIMGIVKAYQEEDFEIPVIGEYTRKIFKSQLD